MFGWQIYFFWEMWYKYGIFGTWKIYNIYYNGRFTGYEWYDYILWFHQTWLAGKSPTKIGSFNGNINYKFEFNGGLSVAMFDFRVASIISISIWIIWRMEMADQWLVCDIYISQGPSWIIIQHGTWDNPPSSSTFCWLPFFCLSNSWKTSVKTPFKADYDD